MDVIEDLASLEPWRGGALVPTMGALHAGHVALIRRAKEMRPPVLVSIFINPTQFSEREDFARYPRDLERDLAQADAADADAVFAPSVEVIYPPDAEIVVPPLPDVATKPGLEDRFRPGHFAGVCQIVARLFDLTAPAIAIFGEKDYQQLKTIESMVAVDRPRWPGLEIIPHETVREPDGLALSSRNQLLSESDRARALGLWRALSAARDLATPGRDVRRIEERMRAILIQHRVEFEYAVIRHHETLMPIDVIEPPARALVAGRVATTRLIDNCAI